MNTSSPIRVLQVLGALNIGGAETMVMNLYRNIDREKVQFDFVIHTTAHCDFTDEILSLGGKIYSCPRYIGKNHFQYCRWWKEFLKNREEYRIIHGHVRSTAALYLMVAKKLGRVTIAHSHSTSNGKGMSALVKDCMQLPIRYIADYMFACSKDAGEWLFGKRVIDSNKYRTIKNAIDIEKFSFDNVIREDYRRKLGLEEKNLVYGHIGRFHEAKNYPFLLEVFEKIYSRNRNARLILVGDGDLRDEIENQIEKLKLTEAVILLGFRKDTAQLMQAMDVFLFPSKWEGLPVTVVEAQATGLPCFISRNITKEVVVSELVNVLSIGVGSDVWVEIIESSSLQRKNVIEEIVSAGFEITTSCGQLQEFYVRVSNE